MECHICYENITEGKGVTCENGHSCCQKHHLERIRAMYQEGRSAFGGLDVGGGGGQSCFLCRCCIGDHRFSSSFFNVLKVIQLVEIPKLLDHPVLGRPVQIHPLDLMKRIDGTP